MKPRIGICGYGRFGQLWAGILRSDFDIAIYDSGEGAIEKARIAGVECETIEDLLKRDVIIYAVPISAFRETLLQHISKLGAAIAQKVFIDVLSVKVYPKKIFEEALPPSAQAMLTHPLFGPDSVGTEGLPGHRIVIDRFTASDETFEFWVDYFRGKELQVLCLTAEEHDRLAAESQGLTHAIGRVLGEFELQETVIDTVGARKLNEVKSQVCNDTWELFRDLQNYNPFTPKMRQRLGRAQQAVFGRLLPRRIFQDRLVVGIQGGPGSFNEEAMHEQIRAQGEPEFEVRYLHTTKKVLEALERGEIDIGQFAVCNSVGGIVHESMEAMGHYSFTLEKEFSIPIQHALLIRKDADLTDIRTVISHPQALLQCQSNLRSQFPSFECRGGGDDMPDASQVAERLATGTLGKEFATLGCRKLANLYGLTIAAEQLQDRTDNRTTFVWVTR